MADVLLLHGEESFLVDDEALRTLKGWRSELVSDFGFESLDGSSVTAERLKAAVLQAPFLDPCRVVAVRGVPPRRADQLAKALAEVPDTTRLLVTVGGKLASASALIRAVVTAGGAVKEHAPLRARALQDWVAERARGYGLSPMVAALITRLSRPDLGIVDSELKKLAAYKASGNELDRQVVEELLAGGRPEDIFRLTDNLVPQPTARAWSILEDLLQREQPTTLAYRLARHLALVLEIRTRQDRGETLREVQGAMREHPFVLQKAFDSARTTTPDRLEAGLRALLAYEWEVKSGQVDAEQGLLVTLAKL